MNSKLKVLIGHYDGNPTFVVGNWCQNGCQTFHKDDAQDVFDEFEVPEDQRKDVMDLFSDEKIDFNLFFDSIASILELMDVEDLSYLVSKICDDEKHLKSFLQNHYMTSAAKKNLARKDMDSVNEILINDSPWIVRLVVVRHTTSKEILLKLTKDKDSNVSNAAIRRLTGDFK